MRSQLLLRPVPPSQSNRLDTSRPLALTLGAALGGQATSPRQPLPAVLAFSYGPRTPDLNACGQASTSTSRHATLRAPSWTGAGNVRSAIRIGMWPPPSL